ncbi:hypothetical protein [Methyloterricola oryzae]|uniref:hypothetical protein n=1 Tax=Methyloterricola oryzae TaxID=1495050 RepID=UPI0005EB3E6C|nr:hypothetical protein [Methyloterricola oryzae]
MPEWRVWIALGLAGISLGTVAEMADPTRPALNQSAAELPSAELPKVSGIVIQPRGRHALLDGTVTVRVGQRWQGLEVLAIEPGRVRVRKDDQVIDLPLVSQVKKTRRKDH